MTGASCGIALEFAAAGATVYLSGRRVESAVLQEREGTIVDTAELIADAGAPRFRSDPTPRNVREARGDISHLADPQQVGRGDLSVLLHAREPLAARWA